MFSILDLWTYSETSQAVRPTVLPSHCFSTQTDRWVERWCSPVLADALLPASVRTIMKDVVKRYINKRFWFSYNNNNNNVTQRKKHSGRFNSIYYTKWRISCYYRNGHLLERSWIYNRFFFFNDILACVSL